MALLQVSGRPALGPHPLPWAPGSPLQQHRPHQLLRPGTSTSSRSTRNSLRTAAAWGSPPLNSLAEVEAQIQQQMDALTGTSLSSDFAAMDRQFRDMNRRMDATFADLDRLQQQLDADLERSLRQLQQQEPGVSIRRSEERSPGSYRYYESIQIRSGSTMATLTPAHSHTAPFFNPLLFIAVVLAGAYAAVTAAFHRSFGLTTYKQGGAAKWQLLLLWPFLLPFSANFRSQFSSALRGQKVKVLHSMDEGGSS